MAGNRRRGAWRRRAAELLRAGLSSPSVALRRARRMLLFVGLGSGLFFAGQAGWDAAKRSPYFRVRQIEVTEVQRLDRDEVVRLAGLDAPTSLFAFDTAAAEDALRKHPWIRSVRVEKRLPDTVLVHLTQRQPAAVVALSGLYLVDAAGHPFVRPTGDEGAGLPLVTGLTRAEYEADPEAGRVRFVNAMSLARMYQQSPMSASRPLGSVHVAPGGRYELMLGRTRVSLGHDDHRRRLNDLARILEKLKSRNVDAAYILLDEGGQRAIVREIPLDTEIQGSLTMHAGGVKD